MKRYLIAAAAVAGLVAGVVSAAPSADAGGIRLLNFQPGELTSTITAGASHYYLTYSLANPADEARRPRLRIELRTETEKTYGDHYDARVFEAAAKDQDKEGGYTSSASLRSEDLAAGASADGLANFGRIDPNADELTVRVYGLFDPIWRDKKGNVYSERRVLVLKYRRYGDEYSRHLDRITLQSTTEEVEGEPVLLVPSE